MLMPLDLLNPLESFASPGSVIVVVSTWASQHHIHFVFHHTLKGFFKSATVCACHIEDYLHITFVLIVLMGNYCSCYCNNST